jgi:rfaE bifunctional protein nucleotidyltransferase chain/domain
VESDGIGARVDAHRRAGRRIVLTNGCFDLLHRGHLAYLSQARALGDVLVVGVNSDPSVRGLKGPRRPVVPAEDRAALVAGLACVDHVVVFAESTPDRLIRELRPEVYVKGGDYRAEDLPERGLVEGYGGRVAVLAYLPGRSTTAIIDRIRDDLGRCLADPAGDR